MFAARQQWTLISRRSATTLSRLSGVLAGAGRVAVLFLVIASCRCVRTHLTQFCQGASANEPAVRAFEFTSEFYTPMAPGRLEGLIASDGSQARIAVYWIEPYLFRESEFFLRYADFIFNGEDIHYWIHGLSHAVTFHLTDDCHDPLLPGDASVESAVRSALVILRCIRSQNERVAPSLEVAKFFQESRARAEYRYEPLRDEPDSKRPSNDRDAKMQTLNSLPYGREYSKEKRGDGTVVWRVRKATNGQLVVSVTIRPVQSIEKNWWLNVFDTDTLGRWPLIPQAYRDYWSFDLAYAELNASPHVRFASREYHDRLELYLDDNEVPPQARRALDRLCFKTALMTDDVGRVRRSTQRAVAGLCAGDSTRKYQGLLELGSMAGQIDKQYGPSAEEWLRPLVGQIVIHAGRDIVDYLDGLMRAIDRNNWFTYGRLLLQEIRQRELIKEDDVNVIAARLEASRQARNREPPSPCESFPSVKEYLAHLDAEPPRGTVDMDDLRQILQEGLAKHCTDSQSGAKRGIVENVVHSIRLIVGEGPFHANKAELTLSVERFSQLYLTVNKIKEPLDTVLATFLALSFCDNSTAEDHALLFSQFHKCCVGLQSQVDTMLRERGLGELVTPEDVERVFARYEETLRRCVDDPLWAPFKFPLTDNEEARLANKLKLRLAQLEPFLDRISVYFKYGGGVPQLRDRVIHEISRAAQQLLPEAASLRNPPYPGVSCQYRAGCGFTVVIEGPLYQGGNHPREKFKAMKYFHLGHRLEEIVKHEAELARPTRIQEQIR